MTGSCIVILVSILIRVFIKPIIYSITKKTKTELDDKIIEITQDGLPLVPQPYHHIAEKLGVDVDLVKKRLRAMKKMAKFVELE